MSKFCDICGKGPVKGCNVSHANNHTKRRWLPNLQRTKTVVDGQAMRITVCTRCLRSGKVSRGATL